MKVTLFIQHEELLVIGNLLISIAFIQIDSGVELWCYYGFPTSNDNLVLPEIFKLLIDRGFEPMNPFTGLSLESSCFNHLHKRIFTGIKLDIPLLFKCRYLKNIEYGFTWVPVHSCSIDKRNKWSLLMCNSLTTSVTPVDTTLTIYQLSKDWKWIVESMATTVVNTLTPLRRSPWYCW